MTNRADRQEAELQTVHDPETASADAIGATRPTVVTYDQGWLASFLRPALLALMVACLNFALLTFLRRFIPELGQAYATTIAALGIIAAVVGSTTTAWLAQPGQRLRRTAAYRLAELALLLFVTRLAVWVTIGAWPTLRLFVTRPLSTLFDGLFLVAATVVTISWVIATEMSRDLLDMALQPDELQLIQPDSEQARDGMRAANIDRRLLMNSFVVRWVIGGLLLIFLAAGSTMDFGSTGFAGLARLHIPGGIVVAIVVYFLAGLLLVSQGQLAILRARWTLEQSPSDDAVAQHWPIYVGTVIVLVGAIAALMPLGGTFWLSRIISATIGAIYFIFLLIFQIFSGLFILLLSLLPFQAEQNQPPAAAPQPIIPEAPAAPSSEFLEWASGATFWLIAAALLGYLATIYFTDKGVRLAWLTWFWAVLRTRWFAMRQSLATWQGNRLQADDPAEAGEDARGRHSRRMWPWQRNSDADARVRALYFAVLTAAEEAGRPRRRAETPTVYAPRLAAPMQDPVASEAIDALTDAFVDVRYGQGHADAADITRLESYWAHLREMLRRR